jgi:hypothetical protein
VSSVAIGAGILLTLASLAVIAAPSIRNQRSVEGDGVSVALS